jgi:sugar lactone lactonase YvrE
VFNGSGPALARWAAALGLIVAAAATDARPPTTEMPNNKSSKDAAMFESTLKPFAKGDIFAAVTQLNNPNDDHAGRGRILQYDAAGYEKGVLWLKDTTHLVGGLKFDSHGVLWAFDSQSFAVINVLPSGQVVRRNEFPRRPFSHVNFAADGTLYLAEHVVGNAIKPEIAARMHTQLPMMPGSDRFGDGHVWHFKPDGTLLKEYATQTHGGMGGFLGVTMSALSPDGSTLVYCSETGPRLMRYDLKNDRQLPDLQSFQAPTQGPPAMFFGMEYAADGTLYVLRGAGIEVVSESGQTVRQIPLPGFGWAIMDITTDGKYAYVGSFFSGEILKIELASGSQLGSIKTGGVKALAGVVEYQGEGIPAAKPAAAVSERKTPASSRRRATVRRASAKRKKARKKVRKTIKKSATRKAAKRAQPAKRKKAPMRVKPVRAKKSKPRRKAAAKRSPAKRKRRTRR